MRYIGLIYFTVWTILLPFYIKLFKYIFKDEKEIELIKIQNDEIKNAKNRIHYLSECISIITISLAHHDIEIELPLWKSDLESYK